MMAVVGSETSFDQGREQMELLAGLEVTRKAVERHSEAIGADIAHREEVEIQRASSSICPRSPAATFLFSTSRWTEPACLSLRRKPKAERVKPATSRRIPVKSSWAVCSHKPVPIRRADRCVMIAPQPTPEP